MAEDDLVEVKFRLFDGTDIGPNKYDPSTTVGSLKETILLRWPQEKGHDSTPLMEELMEENYIVHMICSNQEACLYYK